MKNILFIQPYRYGDILQVQPIVRSVKRYFRDAKVWFVADDSFCEILKNSEVDRVLVYPRSSVIRAVKIKNDLEAGLSYSREFVTELTSVVFDAVINFNYSDTAGMIASAARSDNRHGRLTKHDGSRVINGFWSRYLLFFTAARRYNKLNLVEMFYRITEEALGIEQGSLLREELFYKPTPNSAVRVSEWLSGRGLSDKKLIGFQVGASKKSKMKLNDKFPALAEKFSSLGFECLLFGGPGERAEAESIMAKSSVIMHNTAGEFDMEDNYSMLKRLSLFITSDTLNMHLAAAAGTKLLVADYGDIFPWETTPFAAGVHVLVKPIDCWPCNDADICPHMKCAAEITPLALYKAAMAIIFGGDQMELKLDMEVLRTEVNIPNGFDMKLLSGEMTSQTLSDTIFREIYSSYWERIFDSEAGGKKPVRVHADAASHIWERYGRSVREEPEREREMAMIFKKRLTAYASLSGLVSDALSYADKAADEGSNSAIRHEASEILGKILEKILEYDSETAMLRAYFSVETSGSDGSLKERAACLKKMKYALSSFVYAIAYIMQKMYEDTFVGGAELLAL